MATVITFGNFKGGVGKTTNCVLTAYALSKMGKNVLLIDFDPQGDTTKLVLKSAKSLLNTEIDFDTTLMVAMQEGNIAKIVTPVLDNLSLVPSFEDFRYFPKFLERKFPNDDLSQLKYFESLLEPLQEQFDFILIDIPPTYSSFTDNALYASDYIVVLLQTHERSLEGAESFVKYLQTMVTEYDAKLDILGILAVIMKSKAKVDSTILEIAEETFGKENIMENSVNQMERLKRYDLTGITLIDYHDKKVLEKYTEIAKELISRIEKNN